MISIRIAQPSEQQALEALLEQIVEGCVHVALLNGNVAVFSVVLARDDGDVELDGLFIEPDLWRRRIGQTLVRYAARRAAQNEAAWMHVTANPDSEAFYIANGFEFTGKVQTRFGQASTMRKALTP